MKRERRQATGFLRSTKNKKDLKLKKINFPTLTEEKIFQVNHDKELAKADKEAGARRAAFWAKLGVNFIERYFYLILFNVYCTEQVSQDFKVKFADWCEQRQDLVKILGTRESGPLSTFNWA